MRRKIPRARACFFCGTRLATLTQHHLVPVVRGGTHAPGNLVNACWKCTFMKGGGFTVQEFRQCVLLILRASGIRCVHVQFHGEGGQGFRWPRRFLPNVGRRRAVERVRLAAPSVAGHVPCRWCDAWLPPRELAKHQPACPRRPRKLP